MILVTGATGFIGREFIKQLSLLVDKKNIVCLVYDVCNNDLEKSGRKNLDELEIKYIPIDLISGRGMENIPKSPDIVFHLASVTITASPDHSVNDIGTRNLIRSISPIKKGMNFIYTSTICVNDKRQDYNTPITEFSSTPSRPANLYGRKKLIAENFLIESSKKNEFTLSIIRVCGVYGPGVRQKGLFDSAEKLVKKKSILTRLNWPGIISIIHVSDMANLILQASQKKINSSTHDLYIPSIEALTLAEMSKIIHQEYGITYKPIKLPNIFWIFCRFIARYKHIIEYVIPHNIYDRFWQACILVNNEFWNESKKIYKLIPDWKPFTYLEYYKNKAKESK